MRPVLARHHDLRMRAVEAVEEVDVFELVDPAAKAQDVVGRGRQEGDWDLIFPKNPNICERLVSFSRVPRRAMVASPVLSFALSVNSIPGGLPSSFTADSRMARWNLLGCCSSSSWRSSRSTRLASWSARYPSFRRAWERGASNLLKLLSQLKHQGAGRAGRSDRADTRRRAYSDRAASRLRAA